MFYEDNHIKIYNKDCRFMSELPDESVQCVVTSPPYWGLRKYSGEQELIWGGNMQCDHNGLSTGERRGETYRGKRRWQHNGVSRQETPEEWVNCEHQWGIADTREMNYVQGNPEFARPHREHKNFTATTNTCSLCGAWRGSYGLEPQPEMYIQHTIEILREIRRVLRKDGCVFWNCGDSYYGSGGDHKEGGKNDAGFQGNLMRGVQPKQQRHNLLKPKDLCLIPFRVAIAAQEDGWWVRSVIIWSKPNPMPESVTDRPTESHEYILMLTKSKKYYWDADAVREPQQMSSLLRATRGWEGDTNRGYPNGPQSHIDKYFNKSKEEAMSLPGRNIRSVWEFPTQPYPEAHFAVFPEKLPEICIKAATPEVGCCSKCGAPWERVTESKRGFMNGICNVCGEPRNKHIQSKKSAMLNSTTMLEDGAIPCGGNETLGWQPTCKCNADKVPSIVLDNFAGAGTTLWVAKKLNRRAVGYEISEEYCQLAVDRSRQQVLL